MNGLLKSRKFWLMIADIVFSTAIYFVGKYVAPVIAEDVLWMIGMYQPIVIAVIVGIAAEDVALKSGGGSYQSGVINGQE